MAAIERVRTASDASVAASPAFGVAANLALAAAFCMNFRCDSLAVAFTGGLVPAAAPAGDPTGGGPDIIIFFADQPVWYWCGVSCAGCV